MRAAVGLSAFFLLCGVAALFGIPAVQFDGQAILGVRGFVIALSVAALPPAAVLGWRRLSGK
jgi:hypothetical protein